MPPPPLLFECAYCFVTDDAVDAVGECGDRCMVYAHATCLARRPTTAVWRKKHAQRDNADPELCPRTGCVARFTPRRARRLAQPYEGHARPFAPRRAPASPTASPTDDQRVAPCVFFARDGTPCKREAVAHGACRLHANDAHVLRLMTAMLEEDLDTGVACQTTDDALTRAVGTQTAPSDAGTAPSLRVVEALRTDVGLLREELARARETELALRAKLEDVTRAACALLAQVAV
jgi:hypothetical protein